jgi:hypothetical protein
VKPQEIAGAALDAAKAGAARAHIHVRDAETGPPSMKLVKSPNLADRPELAHEKLCPSMALIDPKALTRGPIEELFAKAFCQGLTQPIV